MAKKSQHTPLEKSALLQELCNAAGRDYAPLLQEIRSGISGSTAPVTPLDGLLLYTAQLMRWNSHINLVGARHWQEAVRDLLVDSLFLSSFLQELQRKGLVEDAPQAWDLGSGAGLPGIPLRLLWSSGEYWLIEARQKRAIFLADMVARLELPRTCVHKGRAEAFFATALQPASLVVSRAFMPWQELLAFVEPHCTPEAVIVILANDTAPVGMPATWHLLQQYRYPSGSGFRFFWALSRRGRQACTHVACHEF